DLAGVDADPDRDLDTVAQLLRRAHSTQRVVLAHRRHPEDRHHRVADELLERPAVPLDRRAGDVEVPGHDVADRFRIARLGEGGRARDVAEEDGDDLPLLARRRRGERRAARVAETCAFAVLGTAARAGHVPTVLRAVVLGEPPREATVRRVEPRLEIAVEAVDLRTQLDDAEIELALLLADVLRVTLRRERRTALGARHVV